MEELHIKDILLEFNGEDLSKYGLFPLFAWYLMDYIHLMQRFEFLTVKKKRNNLRPIKRRTPRYSAGQMGIGIVALILLGIKRFRSINRLLATETKLAELLGLKGFFDQATAHRFLNEFQKWHLKQLERVGDELEKEFGEAFHQDLIVLDIDSTTHSLESRKRQKAVRGYNKKNPGKPCYQWSVGFIRGEAVAHKLYPGNTVCKDHLKDTIESVMEKIYRPISIVRLDGGYLSAELLNYIDQRNLQVVMAARYDWVMAQGPEIDPDKWESYDEKTKLYDLGLARVMSTVERQYRIILVVKEQKPFPGGKRKKTKQVRYAIIENLAIRLESNALYEFYCERQTIENFFKESKGPFHSGKMPSQRFRACEAYLHFVVIAYNLFQWFKKNFCPLSGDIIKWRPFESSSSNMG